MPKISVIVPVYKVEPYIRQCVDSILNQTYTDFELILVDDGSPDQCPFICDEYAREDKRVVVIHKENGGLSSARNAGLDIAKGEFYFFVDSDDFIENTLFEDCIDFANRYNTKSVKYSYNVFDGNRIPVQSSCLSERYYKIEKSNRVDFVANTLLTYSIKWESWSWMYSGDIIREKHLRFADNKHIFAEDIYFSCLYSLYIDSLVYIDKKLYFYRRRNDSIMGSTNEIKINEMNRLSFLLSKYYIEYKDFFLIHYRIIMNRVSLLPKLTSLHNIRIWKQVLKEIDYIRFFKMNNKYFYDSVYKKKCFLNYNVIVCRYLYTFNVLDCLWRVCLRRFLKLFSLKNK